MKRKFFAELTWGVADADPSIASPEIFRESKKEWVQGKKVAFTLLTPHLKCFFIPDNITSGIEGLFTEDNFKNEEDLEAASTEIIGLDFAQGAWPAVSARSTFYLSTPAEFSEKTIQNWEDENSDSIGFALSFEWHFGSKVAQSVVNINGYDELNFNLSV